jgi:hypothetical protein
MFPIIEQKTCKSLVYRFLTLILVAGSIEISNQLISDLLEFVEVAEELINADVIRKNEFAAN